jgi:hypothetical protein
VLWECPFNHGRNCALFDGDCDPKSDACLLAQSPFAPPADEEGHVERLHLTSIAAVEWPQPATRRTFPEKRRSPAKATRRRPKGAVPER